MQSIHKLDEKTAARIAAGEVIERPESILRELLDNSIDAKSTEITVEIEGGGIESVKVSDNGSGIKREDLDVICSRHATSKIQTENDLYNISTLGFRGEALYSISSVTKLKITTFDSSRGEGYTLEVDNGERKEIERAAINNGTIIEARDLFLDIPARRNFLKKSQSEANACKSLLISRALSNPFIAFKFYQDGALKLKFDKAESLKERVMALYRPMGIESADVVHLRGKDEDFSIDIIATVSAKRRSDRKEIRIYVNGRPVDEYSLVQAVTYGYGEMLPGGSFPYASVFIQDKAELVDFNIHPAKKEVKLRNHQDIHHAIVVLLKNGLERVIPEIKGKEEDKTPLLFEDNKPFIQPKKEEKERHYTLSESVTSPRYNYRSETRPKDNSWIEKAKELRREREERIKEREEKEEEERGNNKESYVESSDERDQSISFSYVGQAFNLFLIAEVDDELYFVDQHAAHERIIYDDLLSKKSVQKLLIPIKLDTEEDVKKFLENNADIYSKLGIEIEKKDGDFYITALPSVARSIEDEVASFISVNTGDEKELEMNIFAIIACKAAIKAGDHLDKYSAEAILERVFKMEEPACPHGRTFLIKLKEKELREMVGRTK